MKKKYFGTDGIRGIANVYPMTGDLIYRISKVAARILKRDGRNFVFIGKDTRLSCDMLEAAIASGLMSEGIDVYRLGVVPTPALSFITSRRKALFGVMISASHNPFYDNGIKFIGNDGFKLSDSIELQIEGGLEKNIDHEVRVTHKDIGRIFEKFSYVDFYVDHVLEGTENIDFSDLKVLVDCANGATSEVIPEIMKKLGVKYQIIDNNPTGDNINNECGSTNLEKIAKIVKEEDFDCGIAFDGDGDRCLMVDENGEVMDGDVIMSLYYVNRIKKDKNFNKKIVSTVMSNMGFKNVVAKQKGIYLETTVGDKYVLEKMIKENAVIGGEQSGHIINLEKNTTGDGPATALEMLKIRACEKKAFSELVKETGFVSYPQVLVNVTVKTKEGLWEIPELDEMVKNFNKEFKDRGRLLIRPSGTEPFIRVMAEARDIEKAKIYIKDISDILIKKMG
ncbi:MAG: phosphoglucosamine mutase [Candidatus Muirbacterium halophilum]|nr:phosphoglucosamine mutase [Candidatus Muirbacterium halophilum]MCK9474956.1 phosphoglucosamine mutase [Candidatus Muirbacterium halophilum]